MLEEVVECVERIWLCADGLLLAFILEDRLGRLFLFEVFDGVRCPERLVTVARFEQWCHLGFFSLVVCLYTFRRLIILRVHAFD